MIDKILTEIGIEFRSVIKDNIGMSKSFVYKLDTYSNITFYLKYGKNEVKRLIEVLTFLNGRYNTPIIKNIGVIDGWFYVLMTEVPGKMSCDPFFKKSILLTTECVKVLARALKELHSVDINDFYLVSTREDIIKKCEINLSKGLVDKKNIDDELKGYSDLAIVEEISQFNFQDDLVFTHGDYCAPNVIINNGSFGFIDLDRACISDRYMDIALMIRSIRFNFIEERYVDLFLEEYGIDELDKEKCDFFLLIDDLY